MRLLVSTTNSYNYKTNINSEDVESSNRISFPRGQEPVPEVVEILHENHPGQLRRVDDQRRAPEQPDTHVWGFEVIVNPTHPVYLRRTTKLGKVVIYHITRICIARY